MDLIIDRNTWLRGEGHMPSRLHRKCDGKKCCVGFLALAIGLTPEQIQDIKSLYSESLHELLPDGWKFDEKIGVIKDLYSINDCLVGEECFISDYNPQYNKMTNKLREELIVKYFARVNVYVTFIN